MSGLGSLLFDVGASTVTLQSDLARGEVMTNSFVNSVNLSLAKVGTGANFNGVSSQVQSLTSDFAGLKSMVAGVFGVSLGAGLAKEAMGVADAWQTASNRIRTTVDDQSQVAAIQSQILRDAQSIGAEYDTSTKTYQRLFQAIQATGTTQAASQTQAIALTKTLNEEIVVSGANTGEATRAVSDLVHGLAGGVLQARQFNPIMRQMPDLAKQIADGLGVSVKQLEEMVHKGLPAQQVLDALAKQSSTIDQKFTAMPQTFARAWQQLDNSVEQYIGTAAQAGTLSDVVKAGIIGLGNNISTVAEIILGAAAATAVWLGGRTMTAIGNMAVAVYQAATAQGVYKTAAITSAEADLSAAQASQTATQATLQRAATAAELALAQQTEAESTVVALTAEQRLLEGRLAMLPIGVNVIADTARLEAIELELASATTILAGSEDKLTAAFARQDLAYAAASTSAARATAAQAALTAAQVEAASVTGVLSRAGASLFSLIGGWPTVLLAAGVGFYALATSTLYSSDALKQLEADTASLQHQTGELTTAQRAKYESDLQLVQAEIAQQTALRDQQKAQEDANVSLNSFDGALGSVAAQSGYTATGISELDKKVHDFLTTLQAADQLAQLRSAIETTVPTLDQQVRSLIDGITEESAAVDKHVASMEKQIATYGKGNAAAAIYDRNLELQQKTVGLTGEAYDKVSAAVELKHAKEIADAQALDAVIAAHKGASAAIKETAKDTKEAQVGMTELGATVNSISGKFGGDYAKAQSTYTAEITKLDLEYAKAIALTSNYDSAQRLLQEGVALAAAQRDADIEAIRNQNDASLILTNTVYQANTAFDQQTRLLGMDATARKVEEEYIRLQAQAMHDLGDIMGPLTEDQQKMLDSLHDMAKAHVALDEAQKANMEATRQWADVWTQAGSTIGDDIGKVVVEGESLMDDLVNVAKQTVEAIISYFAKLAIINPILNSIFGGAITGGGGSLLPTLAGGVFGGGSGGGLLGGVLGGGADFTSTASGGTQNSIMQPSSWIMAGKNLFSGFGSGLSTFWNGSGGGFNWSQIGSSDFAEANANNLNMSSVYGAPGGSALGYGGYGSALGQGLGIAGGLYAGYNRFQQGGALGGAAGGLAYGAGTYALGAGLASAAGGAGFAAGVGTAFAIPVVGWIALAAMLIDKFSGGKLFGTDATFNGAQSDLRVGADGAQYVTWADMKGQHALFGGSYHETKDIAETQDQIDAANAFYKALKDGTDQFAHYFGTTAATIVGGTFSTVYDKKGNVKSTSSTVNGITYEGETAEQFSERLTAENEIAVLKQIGVDVTSYTNSFIKDADGYAKSVQDVAQAMAMAQQDLKNGINISGTGVMQGQFDTIQQYNTDGESETDTYTRLRSELVDVQNGLGLLTGQKSISDIEAFLATAQQFGESLSQTYQRLEQASQAYYQFTGQFKPQATYVDDYEAAMANIKAQYIANVKQANDLAKAAGAAGASTEDLTNIMQYAAKQEADALKQLQASAQDLAFSLGLTTTGTLDEVNSEIQRLQQQAGQAASPIASVGNAIQTMAQKATDSINLMLGDLSPYNDQYKLQIALQGMYSGTVTKDQVLSIGKSLWTTTSSEYQALFGQVMAYQGGGPGGGGGGGGAGGAAHQGLSAADSQRLKDLLKEQQALQASATLQQYQTLAQQVAEIASSKGEDWKQVLTGMNVDITAFEKGLGMTDDQTNAYIQAAQDEKDSNKENTASIVYWLQKIFEQGGGTIEVTVNQPTSGGTGHSGHARPMLGNPRYSRGPGGQPARVITVTGP